MSPRNSNAPQLLMIKTDLAGHGYSLRNAHYDMDPMPPRHTVLAHFLAETVGLNSQIQMKPEASTVSCVLHTFPTVLITKAPNGVATRKWPPANA